MNQVVQVLPTLVSTLAGTVLGALIAWLLTHLYARMALRDLRKQREQLERYNGTLTTLLKSWEDHGQVELLRDERGAIKSGRIVASGGAGAVAGQPQPGGEPHRP